MAVDNPTTNYGWVLPIPGASPGVWGSILNTALGDTVSGIDAVVKGIQDTAEAALPKAGGELTGLVRVHSDHYRTVGLGTMSGTTTLDLAEGRFFFGTVGGVVTFAFDNVPAAGATFIMLEIANGGSSTVNWPASVKWPDGSAPALTPSGVDLIAMYTRDGGTTWRATRAQADSS